VPHIHTERGQHDLTASAFIVRLDTPEPTLFLHRHKKLGTFLEFGGHVELDQTPWQAVVDEVEAESGYTPEQLKVLQPEAVLTKLTGVVLHPYPLCVMTHAFDDTHFHTDIEYLLVASSPPNKPVGEGESTDLRAFTQAELLALDPSEVPENIREMAAFIFTVCLSEWATTDLARFAR